MYIFGVYLLPKLKIHIKYLITCHSNLLPKKIDSNAEIHIKIINNINKFNKEDINRLTGFDGHGLVPRFNKNFKLGNRCVTIRLPHEELAAIFWITSAPGYTGLEGFQTILFTAGFTFPHLRGRGILPNGLKHAMLLILSEQPIHRLRFVGNIIFTNRSSLKATRKSGFKRIGISFGISSWGCVYFKDNGKAYFRFFNK